MNIFFVIDDEIVTPKLNGTILPGITRKSVLELARHWDLKTSERRISIDEVLEGLESGRVSEVFGAGTAAVISPVGLLHYRGQSSQVGDGQTGPVAKRFFEHLTAIQYGRENDPFGWVETV